MFDGGATLSNGAETSISEKLTIFILQSGTTLQAKTAEELAQATNIDPETRILLRELLIEDNLIDKDKSLAGYGVRQFDPFRYSDLSNLTPEQEELLLNSSMYVAPPPRGQTITGTDGEKFQLAAIAPTMDFKIEIREKANGSLAAFGYDWESGEYSTDGNENQHANVSKDGNRILNYTFFYEVKENESDADPRSGLNLANYASGDTTVAFTSSQLGSAIASPYGEEFDRYYKFVNKATLIDAENREISLIDLDGNLITEPGYYDFTRRSDDGDGVRFIYADDPTGKINPYTGKIQRYIVGMSANFTDNAFGDNDMTDGIIVDPGIPSSILPVLGNEEITIPGEVITEEEVITIDETDPAVAVNTVSSTISEIETLASQRPAIAITPSASPETSSLDAMTSAAPIVGSSA
ncbi:MAG: hypothetical protein EBS77_06835, partial [Gammaproteobacteria bacterium]|nr:hypothetical protein [Gammaproteobacteria bacterium]